MSGWAVRVPIDKSSSAAALRLHPGIQVLETEEALWLKGDHLTEELSLQLRKLPDGVLFDVDDSSVLTRPQQRIPAGTLPQGQWVPIQSYFTAVPQPAALAGTIALRVPLRLIPVPHEQPPTALICDWRTWSAYALQASQVRLKALRFALCDDGRVLIVGTPLPPLPGIRLYSGDGVAIPCGLGFDPAVDFATVKTLLDAGGENLIIIGADATCESVPQECLVPAARAAIAATKAVLGEAGGA